MSSVTRICPSQYFPAPIPIVGADTLLVIFLPKLSLTASITIEKTPAEEILLASVIIFFISLLISAIASYLPARRISKMSTFRALRYE